ncbi:nitrilase and fragile histidine triad fusion protein NitFhit [Aplysia californica]|uniref:Bis(5'-adenosyl)-triphosphatase n=1 Tax=Aplysia californica TaxID=6500 RepID=A0ABM1AEZ6_APLCA|nr:nitrilase and fragile histidine triad fusion protein NitFhit [Aplysia californica]XP_005113264.1 nitrilase and fragile histidine triad fusion protein NitFhit [Aplysia californica]XP_005113265.1 nitrilase and fragile histidine triad fusion protein NitFhit [Aplysia californica]XP_012946404.1 nitrilase and fragile histidine triad fusion protein NitFhit [Aplysia californica]
MKWIASSLFSQTHCILRSFRVGRLCTAKMASSSSPSGGNSVVPQKSLIAVCQMTATSDKEENLKTVLELIACGTRRGAKMIFLPEACDYIGESKQQSVDLAEPLNGNFVQQCQKAALEHSVWLSIGGFHQKAPASENQKLLNTHVLINDQGKVEATYDKTHLFDLDIAGKVRLCESDYVVRGGGIVPPVATPIGRVGLAICYDMRFPEMALALAQQGAHLITYPSAFTQPTGMAHWESILRARAIETQCYVVAAAQTGSHNAKRSSYGHAMVVDPWGAVVAQCSEGTGVCTAEVDLAYLNKLRGQMPVMQHRRTDLYGKVNALASSTGKISPDDEPIYPFGHVKVPSAQVFYRTPLSFAFVNIKPVLPGHTLVATLRPVVHLSELSPAELTDLFTTVQTVSEVVKKHFGASSMTVALQDGPEAGQTVRHIHVHILPRKKKDFEDNDDIYDKIQNHDKGWTAETRFRSEEEMAEESKQLRQYFCDS